LSIWLHPISQAFLIAALAFARLCVTSINTKKVVYFSLAEIIAILKPYSHRNFCNV
jgi:uncharacterized protein YoxC